MFARSFATPSSQLLLDVSGILGKRHSICNKKAHHQDGPHNEAGRQCPSCTK